MGMNLDKKTIDIRTVMVNGIPTYVNKYPFSVVKDRITGFNERTGAESVMEIVESFSTKEECIERAKNLGNRNCNPDVSYGVYEDMSCYSTPSGQFFIERGRFTGDWF